MEQKPERSRAGPWLGASSASTTASPPAQSITLLLYVSDYITLVSNGIVTSEAFAQSEPETVRKFTRATASGLQDTLTDPEAAFELALQFIPELPADRHPQELAKLKQTTALWESEATKANGLGYSDPAVWQTTHQFLRAGGLLQTDVDVQQAFTNDLRK